MKNKIKLIIMLFVLACLSLSVGFACSGKEKEPIKISGFDESVIVSEITVNAGENVSIQAPLVIDENNNVLDVHVLVTDSLGGYVEVKANKFFALDGDGYTIKYLVQTYDGNTHVRTTKVKVNGNFYLGVNMQQVYFLGDTITLNATHKLENPAISYEVKDPDGVDVQITDDKFVASKAGFYNLTVTAVDAGRTYTYDTVIYVYEYASDFSYGAIEVFDENWETIRKLSGYGFQNWSLTHSDECGILSHKGTKDYFIKATTAPGWQGGLDFWLNPMFAKENYEALLAKGYSKIFVPIYVQGNIDAAVYTFTTGHVQNDTSYMYQVHKGGLTKNGWKLVEINLADTYQEWQRSFLSSYDIYANQIAQFIRISGTSGDVSFYMGSIYAMKDVSISHNYTETNLSVGASKTFKDYVSVAESDVELEFSVSFRDEIVTLSESNSTYRFAANGEYTVSAYPKMADLKGGVQLNVTVSDDVALSFTEDADHEYPRDPASVRIVKFEDLGVILTDGQGDEITDVSYEVYYDGERIDSADEDFTAAKDGKYTVVAVGRYGDNLITYKDFKVNIYSVTELGMVDVQETKSFSIVDSINEKMEYETPKSFTSYKLVKIVGIDELEVDIANVIDGNGNFDTTAVTDGYYKVYATDTNNVDELVYFDIWDSNEGHFWNYVSEDKLDYVEALGNFYQRKLGYAYKDQAFTQKAIEIVEYEGKSWYKYSHTDNYDLFFTNGQPFGFKQSVGFEIKPIHSKAYYEELAEQGYKVIFDFMFTKDLAEGNTSTYSNFVYHNTGWTQRGNLASNTIYTFAGDLVQLDALIANYDFITSGTTNIDDSYKNAFIVNYWAAWNNSDQTGVKDVDMYISNIRLSKGTASVTTEYYLANEDGSYNETPNDKVTNTEWTGGGIKAAHKVYNGYYVDMEKTGSLVKYDIKEGDQATIKVYYAKIPGINKGLVDTSKVASINIATEMNNLMSANLTYSDYKFYTVYGTTEIAVENAPITDGVLDLTGVDGQVFVEMNASDGNLYRLTLDAYNSNNPTWTKFGVNSVVLYKRSDGSAATISTAKGELQKTTKDGSEIDVVRFVAGNMSSHNWYVFVPIHSKAYYETLVGQGYTVKHSVYVEGQAGVKYFNQLLAYGAQIDTDGNMTAKWHEITVSLDKYLDNWDNYTNPVNYNTTGAWGTRNSYGMFYMYAPQSDAAILVTDCVLVK